MRPHASATKAADSLEATKPQTTRRARAARDRDARTERHCERHQSHWAHIIGIETKPASLTAQMLVATLSGVMYCGTPVVSGIP